MPVWLSTPRDKGLSCYSAKGLTACLLLFKEQEVPVWADSLTTALGLTACTLGHSVGADSLTTLHSWSMKRQSFLHQCQRLDSQSHLCETHLSKTIGHDSSSLTTPPPLPMMTGARAPASLTTCGACAPFYNIIYMDGLIMRVYCSLY